MQLSEFFDFHLAALEANEARHNMMLACLPAANAEPGKEYLTWTLGGPGQCAIATPGRGHIILGDVDEEQCRQLAEQTSTLDYRVVAGPEQTATWFAQRAVERGKAFSDPSLRRIHALSESPIYPGAPGHARLAEPEDADIVVAWAMEFAGEATPNDQPPPRSGLERMVNERRVLFWNVGEEPVAMATIMSRTRHAANLSLVYTRPRLRNRGYAGAAVAALVERIYAEGRTIACLYSDLRNPISNRCYAKIGFRPVCDSIFYSLRQD